MKRRPQRRTTKTRAGRPPRGSLASTSLATATGDIASLLEVLAAEYPALLPSVVEFLANSAARPGVLAFCKVLKVKDPASLPAVCAGLAHDLNRLEKRWRNLQAELGGDINLEGLAAFAERRAIRWAEVNGGSTKRSSGAVRVERLLSEAVQHARARAEIRAFLDEKPSPDGAAGARATIARIERRHRNAWRTPGPQNRCGWRSLK